MYLAIFRNWPLLFGFLLLLASTGVQGSLVGIRIGQEAFGNGISGIIIASYYIGMIFAALFAPSLIRKAGHIQAFAAFISIVSASMISYLLVIDPLAWFLFRFVIGFCNTSLYIIAESWLNDQATNEIRGKLLSCYMIVQFIGFGGGQFILNLAPPEEPTLFIVISILVSLALVPMMFNAPEKPESPSEGKLSLKEMYMSSPFGCISMLLLGASHATIFGLSGYYGFSSGLEISQIALMVMLFISGGAVGQWPLGRLSDQYDRRVIVSLSCMGAVVAFFILSFIGTQSFPLFFITIFIAGALAIPPYSITVAHVNDSLPRSKMVAASSTLFLIHGVGSVLGPLGAASSIGLIGPAGFFIFLLIVNSGLAAFSFYRTVKHNIDLTRKRLMRFTPFRATAITTRSATTDTVLIANLEQNKNSGG